MVISTNEENFPNKSVDLFLSWLHARSVSHSSPHARKFAWRWQRCGPCNVWRFWTTSRDLRTHFFWTNRKLNKNKVLTNVQFWTSPGSSALCLLPCVPFCVSYFLDVLQKLGYYMLLCYTVCDSISKRKAQHSTERFASRLTRGTIFHFPIFRK